MNRVVGLVLLSIGQIKKETKRCLFEFVINIELAFLHIIYILIV